MRGINRWTGSGNVGDVIFGKTRNDTSACSFMLATEKAQNEPVWVRINVYGQLAAICGSKLNKGDYVMVDGELMNRSSKVDSDKMVEIRCMDIVFTRKD